MSDIIIIIIIALISIAFSGRIPAPELLLNILYNSEFKEEKEDGFINEVKQGEIKSEVNEKTNNDNCIQKPYDDFPVNKEVDMEPKVHKEEYLDDVEVSTDYSMEEIKIDSKSLIKEILSRGK